MKIAFSKIIINPSFPITQRGFINQTEPIFEFHDDLYARIIGIEDNEKIIYLLSLDLLGVDIDVQNNIQNILQKNSDKRVIVTISCTHNHFGADARNEKYVKELEEKILEEINILEFKEDEYYISYYYEPFDKLGKSRISNYDSNVILQLLTIYKKDKPYINIITYNTHPTILNNKTPFFTSEYPGYALKILSENNEDEFFTFMQGAAGDISTRFTRKRQTYKGVIELANLLICEIEQIKNKNLKKYKLENINYEIKKLDVIHDLSDIDINTADRVLTDREIETLNQGIYIRNKIKENTNLLYDSLYVSKLELNNIKIIFTPNENFSSYLDYINLNNTIMVCYSNGYHPYLTPINTNLITYERFMDTISLETKEKYIEIIKEYGK